MNDSTIFKSSYYFIGSQIIFLFTSYIIQRLLAQFLGPSDYGLYGIIMSIASVFIIIISSSVPVSISKVVSEIPEYASTIWKIGLKIHLRNLFIVLLGEIIISIPLSFLFISDLTLFYFILLAPYIFVYGMYIYEIQYLNGLKEHKLQVKFQITYYLLRLAFIYILLYANFKIIGAIAGNFVASILTSFILLLFILNRKLYNNEDIQPLADSIINHLKNYSIYITIYFIFLTIIQNIDLWFVRILVVNPEFSGFYNASYQFAKIPIFLLQGIFMSIFPFLSNAAYLKDKNKITNIIHLIYKYSFFFVLLLIILINFLDKILIIIVFGNSYLYAKELLDILIISFGIMSINILIYTIFNSMNIIKYSIICTTFNIFLEVSLLIILIPIFDVYGATYANLITSIIVGILNIYLLYSVVKIKFQFKYYFVFIFNFLLIILIKFIDNLFINTIYIILLAIFLIKAISIKELKDLINLK